MNNLSSKKLGILLSAIFMFAQTYCYAASPDPKHNLVVLKNVSLNYFTSTGHSISQGQEYKGSSITSNNDAISILAGRHGDISNNSWLKEKGYAVENLYPEDTNFAVIGNFSFVYKPDAETYSCNNIAFEQSGINLVYYTASSKGEPVKHVKMRNVWFMYSNIGSHEFTDPVVNANKITISCNSLHGTEANFEVIAEHPYNKNDASDTPVNSFIISKVE